MIVRSTELHAAPADDSDVVGKLQTGAPFAMLDDTLGWAWGYAGDERRVGYVRSETVGPA